MKARPQHNFVRHMQLAVFIPMTIVTLFTFVLYILSGLESAYQAKRSEVERISELLAISSSSSTNLTVASRQIAQVAEQDPIIESTKFYPLERVIDINNTEPIPFYTILTQASISIQEPVVSSYKSSRNNGGTIEQALIGYMNTTIDLHQLRHQWLMEQKYYLIGIFISYLLLAWLIYTRMVSPLKELQEFSDMALEITGSENDNLKPLLNTELNFIEFGNIQALLYSVDYRYHDCLEQYRSLQKRIEKGELTHATSVQNSSFQSMIVHELKTSLNVIFEGLQHLENNYMSNEQQEAVDIIRKGSHQLEFTLAQIIQLNRIEKGQMSVSVTEFQPMQLINELINKYKALAHSKGVAIESNINHVECILRGDDQKIQSIIEVLISNAIKFTEQGRVIVESNLLYFEDSIRWTINVIDTGIGIDNKHLKDIFLPFFQVDPNVDNDLEGVGVGLGLAKRLTQLLKGHLSVVSEVGKGSKFSLVVHLKSNQQAQDLNLLQGVKIAYLSENLLDDAIKGLQVMGAEVKVYESSEAFLEYNEHHQVNVLIIGNDFKEEEVKGIVQQIRDREVSNRLFINYAKADLPKKIKNDLQAAGVDYCRPFLSDHKEQAVMIRSWLAL